MQYFADLVEGATFHVLSGALLHESLGIGEAIISKRIVKMIFERITDRLLALPTEMVFAPWTRHVIAAFKKLLDRRLTRRTRPELLTLPNSILTEFHAVLAIRVPPISTLETGRLIAFWTNCSVRAARFMQNLVTVRRWTITQ
jgi:hypothetical protein